MNVSRPPINPEIFRVQLGLLDEFLHHFVYRRVLQGQFDTNAVESARLPTFWSWTSNSHIKCAVNAWCMVFGGDNENNRTHWKEVFSNDEATIRRFRDAIEQRLGLNTQAWNAYHASMKAFRDNYTAHRHDHPPAVPRFDTAKDIVLLYDEWVRDEIRPDEMDFPLLRHDLRSLCQAAENEIGPAIGQAIARLPRV